MKLSRVHIYFASGNPRRLTTPGFIRALTNSPYAHCAVGYEHVILDPHDSGNQIWPLAVYERRYPTLECRFSLRVPGDPCFDRFALGVPKPALPTVARWFAPWAFPDAGESDCVQTVRHALTNAGVAMPRLQSPEDLYCWCLAVGLEPKELNVSTPETPQGHAACDTRCRCGTAGVDVPLRAA